MVPSEVGNEASGNQYLAQAVISTLVNLGIKQFFVSPGQRNSPLIHCLTAATRRHCEITVTSVVDERAASYSALSWSKATNQPAVLCCTSGTAVANYLPAVIEAYQAQLPLLILSADRPLSLIHCQANQVIDQRPVLESFCRRFLQLPERTRMKDMAGIAGHIAFALEGCYWPQKGPVHINCPFTEPLPAPESELSVAKPFCSINPGLPESLWQGLLTEHLLAFSKCQRPLLVLGDLMGDPGGEWVGWIKDLSGWIVADVLSGRAGDLPEDRLLPPLDHPHTIRALDSYQPDGILQLGRRPVSKKLDQWLSNHQDTSKMWIVVNDHPGIPVAHEALTALIRLPISRVLGELLAILTTQPKVANHPLPATLLRDRDSDNQAPWSMHQAAQVLSAQIPVHHSVFLGNSSTIRAFDYAGFRHPNTWAHRGVSGIEGHLASAMGLALARRQTVSLMLGDLAALHDLNSLQLLAVAQPLVIIMVLFNNFGGGIFEQLPGAANGVDPLISTPHALRFEQPSKWLGLAYASVANQTDLLEAYLNALDRNQTTVIEALIPHGAETAYKKFIKQKFSFDKE